MPWAREQRVQRQRRPLRYHAPPGNPGEDTNTAVRGRPGLHLQLYGDREHDSGDDVGRGYRAWGQSLFGAIFLSWVGTDEMRLFHFRL